MTFKELLKKTFILYLGYKAFNWFFPKRPV